MDAILDLIGRVASDVGSSLWGVLPWLAIGVIGAAALDVFVGAERLGAWLRRRTATATAGSVGAAVLTPFCSCGSTAVVLSMMASRAPWAPIVAFMVASPLTSPAELFLSAGLLGWPFALVFFVGTIVLGFVAGWVAMVAERAGLLAGQARFAAEPPSQVRVAAPSLGGGGAVAVLSPVRLRRARLLAFRRKVVTLGARMLVYFVGFASVGYLLIEVLPTTWLTTVLGDDSLLAILIAASAGIPFYVSSEAALPMLAGLVAGGVGPGAAMAFLVTGAGTSFGAIAGALVIARRRVVALVVGLLWVGGVAMGLVAGAILQTGG